VNLGVDLSDLEVPVSSSFIVPDWVALLLWTVGVLASFPVWVFPLFDSSFVCSGIVVGCSELC